MPLPNGRFAKGEHWRPKAQHWDADWLRREYVEKGRSSGDIAIEAGTTDYAILYWLKKHGIKRRTIAECRSLKWWGSTGKSNPMFGRVGAKNPRYIDGGSPERQRLYAQSAGREFIRGILARDRFTCARCGSGKSAATPLHVHHLKSWAGNPSLRFDQSNVVTLCRPCHSWVHSRANTGKDFIR